MCMRWRVHRVLWKGAFAAIAALLFDPFDRGVLLDPFRDLLGIPKLDDVFQAFSLLVRSRCDVGRGWVVSCILGRCILVRTIAHNFKRRITNNDLTSRGTSRSSSHLFKKPGSRLRMTTWFLLPTVSPRPSAKSSHTTLLGQSLARLPLLSTLLVATPCCRTSLALEFVVRFRPRRAPSACVLPMTLRSLFDAALKFSFTHCQSTSANGRA